MDNNLNSPACKACGHTGDGRYCSTCGQEYAIHRITVKHMLHEVMHFFTHLEKGFGYTLKQLITKPGTMQKEYIAGKRVLYQKPFSMFFLCGTITALVLYWINTAVVKIYNIENNEEIHYYQHYFTLLQGCLVPAYSLILLLIFGCRFNFAEYLVILLYNTSVLFLFVCLCNAVKLVAGDIETGYIEIAFVLLYNIFTNLNIFNDKGKLGVILKTLLSSVLCFVISRVAMEIFIKYFLRHN